MRRANDFYPTPSWAAEELAKRVPIRGTVAEPCVGDGDLLGPWAAEIGWMNDIDTSKKATHHLDAADPKSWWSFPQVRWIITNPPFNKAMPILALALEHAVDGVAFLLRLSFLEPTAGTTRHAGRRDWLAAHPPDRVIVLPRISFTGDGKTDSVTCAWMVWTRGGWLSRGVEVVSPAAEELRARQGRLVP